MFTHFISCLGAADQGDDNLAEEDHQCVDGRHLQLYTPTGPPVLKDGYPVFCSCVYMVCLVWVGEVGFLSLFLVCCVHVFPCTYMRICVPLNLARALSD